MTAGVLQRELGLADVIREVVQRGTPMLGICLGMQVAVIEAARNLAGLEGAMSTEFDKDTPHPVVGLITEWQDAAGSTEERSEDSEMGEYNALLKRSRFFQVIFLT